MSEKLLIDATALAHLRILLVGGEAFCAVLRERASDMTAKEAATALGMADLLEEAGKFWVNRLKEQRG